MPSLKRDPAAALESALCGKFDNFAGTAAVEKHVCRSWASATFTGARHELSLRLSGPDAGAAADGFLANLTEAEFDLRGHILADVALVSEERLDSGNLVRISLEALTVEDC